MVGFASTPGWGNLPQDNWSPIVFSKDILEFFRRTSVADAVTSNKYIGEITGVGSEVRVLVEPEITVSDYKRGKDLERQFLDDPRITVNIDVAKEFRVDIDDIEAHMSIVDYKNIIMNQGAYKLKQAYDTDVLLDMTNGGTTTAGTGTTGSRITVGYDTNETRPLNLLARLARLMDENDVPDTERFVILNPAFCEGLVMEDSKLIEVQVTGDASSPLRNPSMVAANIHGFEVYKSNNLPNATATDCEIIAGHKSATVAANDLSKMRTVELPDTFAESLQGLLVYGKKVIRPEALFTSHITLSL